MLLWLQPWKVLRVQCPSRRTPRNNLLLQYVGQKPGPEKNSSVDRKNTIIIILYSLYLFMCNRLHVLALQPFKSIWIISQINFCAHQKKWSTTSISCNIMADPMILRKVMSNSPSRCYYIIASVTLPGLLAEQKCLEKCFWDWQQRSKQETNHCVQDEQEVVDPEHLLEEKLWNRHIIFSRGCICIQYLEGAIFRLERVNLIVENWTKH